MAACTASIKVFAQRLCPPPAEHGKTGACCPAKIGHFGFVFAAVRRDLT